jgi:DNA helicase-4
MAIYEDARDLQLDLLKEEDLSQLSLACRNFRSRTRKSDTKIILHALLAKGFGKPVATVLNYLLGAAYEQDGVIATENKSVCFNSPEPTSQSRTLNVRQAIDIILFYKVIRCIQDVLKCNNDDAREQWQKSDEEIAALLEESVSPEDVQAAKITTVKEWFSSRKLGLPSHEQAIVIANCHNSLKVVARAGSGKTRTIAYKMLFLVHYLGFRTDEIIALTFNRKAQNELEQRIVKYEQEAALTSRGAYKVITFDALAYNLIRPRETVLRDTRQKSLIRDIVLDALANEEGLRQQVEELMINSFKGDWEKALRLNSISSHSDLERLRSLLTEQSIDGKEVKSKPEKRIADFLFEHDIPYRYEMPFAVDDGHVIRPDFYVPTHKIVIEYYGLRGNEDYEAVISYKRRYWESQRNITLIEINPGFLLNGSDFDASRESDYQKLSELLAERTSHLSNTLNPQRLSNQEILLRLRDRINLDFVDLVLSAIVRAGQMMCSDSTLVEQIARFPASSPEERKFLDILPSFLAMYNDRLVNNNFIDFSKIKKTAVDQINSGKTVLDWAQGRNGIDLKAIKFVFVDEFQDFSDLFRALLLAILNAAPAALVNAVGDDWQMINRFAGSKPELFDQFDHDYPRPMTVYLQTNYRSSGGIVEFCNSIMRLNGAEGKPAIACDALRGATSIIARLDRDNLIATLRENHYFKGDSVLTSIFRLYKPFSEQHSATLNKDGERICFAISRSNNPPLQVSAEQLGIRARNNRELINLVVNRLTPKGIGDFFEAITGHSSKGLEADAVIVLQPKQFPLIHKKSTFLQFFGDTPANLLRDELNLFYVTCSRAKKKLVFLPERSYMISSFLGPVLQNINLLPWDRFPCRLTGPESLHKLCVQNAEEGSSSLYEARDILMAHGFDTFSRPNKIPTRTLLVRQDYLRTLQFLERVAQDCSEFDLRYIILNGLNQVVFSLPGLKSLAEAIAECRVEQ